MKIVSYGAEFRADRHGGEIWIVVERGLVDVEWSDGARRLRAGEEARVPAEADEVGALLDAADAARRAGRTGDAIAALREAVAHDDPRRGMALFLLGKLLLDRDPGAAADAFAGARVAGGLFAEDALAREVEARGRAGQRARAAALARDYLAAYPDGHRRRAVEAWR